MLLDVHPAVLLLVAAMSAAAVLLVLKDFLAMRRHPGVGFYWPLIGHMPAMAAHVKDTSVFLRHTTKSLGWPTAVLFRAGMAEPPRYCLIDPRDVRHLLVTRFDNYPIAVGMREEVLRDFLGNGIFNSDGPKWLVQRKLASREFNANRFRGVMSQVFNRAALKLVDVLTREVSAVPPGHDGRRAATLDLQHWLFVLTLDAFCQIALGVDVGGLEGTPQPFAKAFDACQGHLFERLTVRVATWKLMRALNYGPEAEFRVQLKIVDDFINDLINSILKGEEEDKQATATGHTEEEDLLRRLLPAAKQSDGSYDRVLVRDMVLNLLLAGRDTMAGSMAWTVYELLRNPSVMATLMEELETHLPGKQTPTFDSVADLHYLQACLSESQRLHPSVPLDTKTALRPDVLPSGLAVAANTSLIINNYAMGVCPKIWGADAEVFNPDRWLGPGGAYQKADQAKFPAFNGGKRLCLGMDMANLEMKVVLTTLLRRFEFELIPGQKIVPGMALTLQMANGLKLRTSFREVA